MKIEDYICNECHHTYEIHSTTVGAVMSYSEAVDYKCPLCHSNDTSKVFTPTEFKINTKE